MMMLNGLSDLCVLIVMLCLAVGSADVKTYEFGKDCHVTLEEVKEDRHIYVEYNGRRVSRSCTKFSFEAEEEDYKICVNPQYFSDPQCAVKLEYTSSSGGQLQSVTCSENHDSEYCVSRNKYIYINFEQRNGRDTTAARFQLKLTAKKVSDKQDGAIVGAVLGGVIGGIVLISLLTGLVCWCVCRRKPTQGQVLNQSHANQAASVISPPAYPYSPYSTPLSGSTASPYPTVAANYSSQYPGYTCTQPALHSSQTGSWQHTEKQASAPPPSYAEAIN
ncbi:uncharacterized protein LOC125655260 isoform X3 [Ostrea edulis]|uniref:uncharacterized protein LOC125655260 isoform X3 n=1 Tax=Ostrea edulis TaxID=37623 RepID=UPI0024AF6B59|nr:uncharacterized protein LOC125655260 isoform X3 [Ostrea edulis]